MSTLGRWSATVSRTFQGWPFPEEPIPLHRNMRSLAKVKLLQKENKKSDYKNHQKLAMRRDCARIENKHKHTEVFGVEGSYLESHHGALEVLIFATWWKKEVLWSHTGRSPQF